MLRRTLWRSLRRSLWGTLLHSPLLLRRLLSHAMGSGLWEMLGRLVRWQLLMRLCWVLWMLWRLLWMLWWRLMLW